MELNHNLTVPITTEVVSEWVPIRLCAYHHWSCELVPFLSDCTYHHWSCEWVPFLSDSVPITTEVLSEIHSYQTLCLSPLQLWVRSIPIRLCAYHHLSCEWVPFLSNSVPITTSVVSEIHSYQTLCLSSHKTSVVIGTESDRNGSHAQLQWW
jgi:hypothetical protein